MGNSNIQRKLPEVRSQGVVLGAGMIVVDGSVWRELSGHANRNWEWKNPPFEANHFSTAWVQLNGSSENTIVQPSINQLLILVLEPGPNLGTKEAWAA